MKIVPVILCGGAGTRLWPQSKGNLPKQFIDWGGWTLFGKTLERIKGSTFDYPIITTNLDYLNLVRKHLAKHTVSHDFSETQIEKLIFHVFDIGATGCCC